MTVTLSVMWLYAAAGLLAVILLQSGAIVLLTRLVGELYTYWVKNDPARGLPIGTEAPSVGEDDLYGRPVRLIGFKPTLLFFLSRGCSGCRGVMENLPAIRRVAPGDVALIVHANSLSSKVFVEEFGHGERFEEVLVIADEDRSLSTAYGASVVPLAVVINEDGTVGASGTASTAEEVERLVAYAAARARETRERRDPAMGVGA